MTFSTTTSIGAVLAVAACAAPLWAQPVPYNRSVAGISVLHDGAGSWNIRGYLEVDVQSISAPTDLSTQMVVQVNGTPVATYDFDILAEPTDASGNGCGIQCATFQPCMCVDTPWGDPVCYCGGFIAPCPDTSVDAQSGDEIMIILYPAPGAVPDPDTSDDERMVIFNDEPVGWNRALTSAELVPVPGGPPNEYILEAQVDYSSNLPGPSYMAVFVFLFVNGKEAASFPMLDLDLTFASCSSCDAENCVVAGLDPVGLCSYNEDFCWCGWYDNGASDPVIVLPDDDVEVILEPIPGALPELPGFEEDDELQIAPPDLCPADINNSGDVDVQDLLLLLAAWGTDDDDADIDNSGNVDVGDLLLLLAAWGDCP
jgi:hypothetical protein